jgi:hypothetical protein
MHHAPYAILTIHHTLVHYTSLQGQELDQIRFLVSGLFRRLWTVLAEREGKAGRVPVEATAAEILEQFAAGSAERSAAGDERAGGGQFHWRSSTGQYHHKYHNQGPWSKGQYSSKYVY